LATALLAVVLLGERFTRQQAIGTGVSLIGVVLLLGAVGLDQSSSPARLLGDGLLILSSFSWAIYTVVGRQALARVSPLATVTWANVIGVVPLLLVAAPDGWDWLVTASPSLWAAILYLGLIGSVVGLVTWSWSVRDLGAGRAGQFTYLMPVWVMILAAIVLDERPLPLQLIGAVLVLIGIWLANRVVRRDGRV
jgi:drug/metabolite transporter (DMT)-like permease